MAALKFINSSNIARLLKAASASSVPIAACSSAA